MMMSLPGSIINKVYNLSSAWNTWASIVTTSFVCRHVMSINIGQEVRIFVDAWQRIDQDDAWIKRKSDKLTSRGKTNSPGTISRSLPLNLIFKSTIGCIDGSKSGISDIWVIRCNYRVESWSVSSILSQDKNDIRGVRGDLLYGRLVQLDDGKRVERDRLLQNERVLATVQPLRCCQAVE